MQRATLFLHLTVAVSIAAAARFELTCYLAPIDAAGLDRLFWAVSTPGNPEYLRFRKNVSTIAAFAGGTAESVAAASAWLRAHGGKNITVAPMRHLVTAGFDESALLDDAAKWSPRGLPRSSRPSGTAIVARRDFNRPTLGASRPQMRAAAPGGYSVANQKQAYGIPIDLAASNKETLQMVWGPGTFGYSPSELASFAKRECPGMNLDKISFDTLNHGTPGGDNFGEGSLDISMIASFGMNISTLVSNTNTSMSTEEGDGFGLAFLDFLTELASRKTVPHVLSLSLGSLSAYSCELLCTKAVETGEVTLSECQAYLQTQRQVCMFQSTAQAAAINTALMAVGLRGTSVFGSSGDGGSHWSFGPFHGEGQMPRILNQIGCEYQFPVFPTSSPYIVSVGGTDWKNGDPKKPKMWSGSGGGFSWQFAQPAHQQATVERYLTTTADLPASSSFNASGRAYPDISAVAVEGTSQSSPTFAGLFSMIVDMRLNAGLAPLGFLGPRIWSVAQAFPGEAFEDVTEGNSKTSCPAGFPATKGWDPTTGWGRPIWAGMVKHFASDSHSIGYV